MLVVKETKEGLFVGLVEEQVASVPQPTEEKPKKKKKTTEK